MKRLILFIVALAICHTAVFPQGCLPEGITFTTQEQIDNFQANYPGCTEIEGDVIIGNGGENRTGISNLNGLNGITSIGGNLNIGAWDIVFPYDLISLAGLENLTTIGGWLEISGSQNLTNLIGLEGLTSIGDRLVIFSNSNLTTLSGIDNLNAGSILDLYISYNPSLSVCEIETICNYLASPNGIIDIGNNAPGCNSPEEVQQACGFNCLPAGITFTTQEQIDNFQTNYPDCPEIDGNVMIHGQNITNLNGLNVLTSIGGGLSIYYNPALTSLTGLDNVTSIGGSLVIWVNPALTSLMGLENLTSIEGYLAIFSNNSLTSLTGLDNIDAGSMSGLYIYDNTSLSTCEVQSICDYLAAPNGTIDIHNNAPSCNSQEEVEATCAVVSVEEVAGVAGIRIIPNPARDMITVSLPMPTGNAQLTLFNITGKKLLEKQITRAKTQISISILPPGIYFIQLQNEKSVAVTKLIKE